MSPELSIEGVPNQGINPERDFQRTEINNQSLSRGQGENQVLFRVTEKELIAGCINNDRLCQSELYKRYFSMMSGVAMRYCRSEEDIVQAVNYGFLKVLQNMAKYKGDFSLATWIRTILVHHLIDEYRKSIKEIQNVRLEDADLPEAATEINLAEYHFSDMQLRHMLNQLPDATRTVFNLFAMEGYKHAEISKIMAISEGTSKWHVSEARKRLAEMLRKSTGEEYKKKGTRV
ncbi:MAG TPA: hypothetical protein DIW47_03670 [Bacteroidetes bacterium]|nr:hypothetical protein [Bacteroidota bacterium]